MKVHVFLKIGGSSSVPEVRNVNTNADRVKQGQDQKTQELDWATKFKKWIGQCQTPGWKNNFLSEHLLAPSAKWHARGGRAQVNVSSPAPYLNFKSVIKLLAEFHITGFSEDLLPMSSRFLTLFYLEFSLFFYCLDKFSRIDFRKPYF